MRGQLPTSADVVIIGGGVIGLSAAYQLAAAGVTDVVVIEQGELGGGSTSKAAGGVRTAFSDEVNVSLAQRSLAAFGRFGDEHDQDIDLRQSGYLFLLRDDAQMADFAAASALQRSFGIDSRMIDVAEVRALSPLVSPEGLVGAMWSPDDGHCSPESVVLGYARSARRLGVRIVTGCAVTGIDVADGKVAAVRTSEGSISTREVVCCRRCVVPAGRAPGWGWTCRSTRCADTSRSRRPSPTWIPPLRSRSTSPRRCTSTARAPDC